MANKLYPPVIDNILPAFVGNIIEVPFQLNRAVGRNEFDKVSIIVKTVSTGSVKIDGATTSIINYNAKKKTYTAIFNLDENFLIG
jgi:hypothetical protein